MTKKMVLFLESKVFFLFIFYFFMNDLVLNDMKLILVVGMNARVSIKTCDI